MLGAPNLNQPLRDFMGQFENHWSSPVSFLNVNEHRKSPEDAVKLQFLMQ